MTDPTREISLADLAPERLTFWDNAFGGDGARHEWRMLSDLGLEDLGHLKRIEGELKRAQAAISAPDADADALEQAAARMGAGFDAFLHLVLPTLPRERLTALSLTAKQRLLEWWRARQPTRDDGGALVPLAPPTAPSRPSRGSSRATASRRAS